MNDEYTEVFSGFLNHNDKRTSEKSPSYKSSGGKGAIKTLVDLPAGTTIYIAAWGGKGQYGPYINVKAQAKSGDLAPKSEEAGESFYDEIPF